MVYLIHFDRKFHHAQHYIGFVDHERGHTVESRLEYHRKGQGSKLLRAVAAAGIDFKIADIWLEGDRNFERSLKNKKKASGLCPVCKVKKFRERVGGELIKELTLSKVNRDLLCVWRGV